MVGNEKSIYRHVEYIGPSELMGDEFVAFTTSKEIHIVRRANIDEIIISEDTEIENSTETSS